MEHDIDSIIAHIIELTNRVDRNFDVSPVEILNAYTMVITHIIMTNPVIEDGLTETVPKALMIINHNIWLTRWKYEQSFDFKNRRIGDHNKAYHISQLNFMLSKCEKIKIIEGLKK